MIRILLGWDGLGLVSYCLVIYYQNIKSANAGIVTVLSNRVGDVAILLAVSWMLNYGSWNFFYLQSLLELGGARMLLVLVVLASITKRAQIPFSAWLPAAIAAPTPVSALVHSSTLVTAGVYLLIRFNSLLGVRDFLFWVGVLTMVMSGLGANFEIDLKKIIALSTLSQLGLIIISIGLGMADIAFFHLMTHALFKSLLFLCAGVFIHSIGDTQDIRLVGGLIISCPVTTFYFIGCSMALCGFPFLSGFYSKDLILEKLLLGDVNLFILVLALAGTLFTLTYSVRLVFYLFLNNWGFKVSLSLVETWYMINPMRGLMLLTVRAGAGMSNFLYPVFFVFLPLIFKLIITVLLVLFFFWVNYSLCGSPPRRAPGGLSFF